MENSNFTSKIKLILYHIVFLLCFEYHSQNDSLNLVSSMRGTLVVYDSINPNIATNPYQYLDSNKWESKIFIPEKLNDNEITIYTIQNLMLIPSLQKYFHIKSLDTLLLLSQVRFDKYHKIPLSIIVFSYTSFAPNALDSNYIIFNNGYYYENSNDKNKMYSSNYFVGIIPLKNNVDGDSIMFDFSPIYSFSNINGTIDSVYILNNDSSLSQDVANKKFLTNQQINFLVKINGSNFIRSVYIKKEYSTSSILSTTIIPYDESFEIISNHNCQTIVTSYSFSPFSPHIVPVIETVCPTAKVVIKYGCNNFSQTIKKPFVFVEGFDPGTPSERYNYGCLNWDVLINNTFKENCKCLDLDKNPCRSCSYFNTRDIDKDGFVEYDNLQKFPQLVKKLRFENFDIIYVEFKYSTLSLNFNSTVLEEVINWINQNKTSNHKIIISGASMGGLLSRLALSKMEQNNTNHKTRTWITFDSPLYGANIPLGFQFAIDFYATNHYVFNNPTASNTAIESRNVLLSPASQQMLFYRYNNLTPNWVSPINFNSPNKLKRKIAISNGSNNSISQGFGGGNKMIEINTCCSSKTGSAIKGKGYAEIYSLPYSGLVGKYEKQICISSMFTAVSSVININGATPLDHVPGSWRRTNRSLTSQGGITFYDKHCFVSTISSLAINPYFIQSTQGQFSFFYNLRNNIFLNPQYNYAPHPNIAYIKDHNITPFDVIYAPDNNQQHVEITDDNINFLMNEVSPFDLYLQNETYTSNDADVFEARNTITAGKNVTNKTAIGDFIVDNTADITFRAGDKITLKDGFHAKAGSKFKAYIDPFPCPPVQRLANPDANSNSKNSDLLISESLYPTASSAISHQTINNLKPISIIPNPTEHSIQITLSDKSSTIHHITIKDISGKIVLQKQPAPANLATLNVSELANGIYFVTVETTNSVFTEKLIIQK